MRTGRSLRTVTVVVSDGSRVLPAALRGPVKARLDLEESAGGHSWH
jgi:hypothetical protein